MLPVLEMLVIAAVVSLLVDIAACSVLSQNSSRKETRDMALKLLAGRTGPRSNY